MSYDDVKSVPQLEYVSDDGEIMSETAKKGDYNNENTAFFSDFKNNHDENKLISDDNISFSNEDLSGFLKKTGVLAVLTKLARQTARATRFTGLSKTKWQPKTRKPKMFSSLLTISTST